jgi:hypothetical protein
MSYPTASRLAGPQFDKIRIVAHGPLAISLCKFLGAHSISSFQLLQILFQDALRRFILGGLLRQELVQRSVHEVIAVAIDVDPLQVLDFV